MNIKNLLRTSALVSLPISTVPIVSCYNKDKVSINPSTFFDYEKATKVEDITKLNKQKKYESCQIFFNKLSELSIFKEAKQSDFDTAKVSIYGPEKIYDFVKDKTAQIHSFLFNNESNFEIASKHFEENKTELNSNNFEDYLTTQYSSMTKAFEIYLKAPNSKSVASIKEELKDTEKVKYINNKINDFKNESKKLIDELLKNSIAKEYADQALETFGFSVEKYKDKIDEYDNNTHAKKIFIMQNILSKEFAKNQTQPNAGAIPSLVSTKPPKNLTEAVDTMDKFLTAMKLAIKSLPTT
ncbi:hypothetical protein NPA07_02240 [Mycoplasmopsis caviae]|uniref:Uncharacterized protein n=1 Tax=Mycoplasmopsis caviae TaxID=55603 RepID=A0A3P8KA53_9BACT|nr:hypothetical protein [Mycoplasmopsis caviae]UUD35670.1 hypothetical protein NPA07_02240 [Mycoplasmopsis caviae]VDR41584.1 Uncharacterised protein [Mycoplasmopsis caviae]